MANVGAKSDFNAQLEPGSVFSNYAPRNSELKGGIILAHAKKCKQPLGFSYEIFKRKYDIKTIKQLGRQF